MSTLRIPCAGHTGHYVRSEDAVRIIATLTVMHAEDRAEPRAMTVMFRRRWEDELVCPLEVLRLSQTDAGYHRYTDTALAVAAVDSLEF